MHRDCENLTYIAAVHATNCTMLRTSFKTTMANNMSDLQLTKHPPPPASASRDSALDEAIEHWGRWGGVFGIEEGGGVVVANAAITVVCGDELGRLGVSLRLRDLRKDLARQNRVTGRLHTFCVFILGNDGYTGLF